MTFLDLTSSFFLMVGAFFFFAGTVGLLRFPNVHSRLHALSKADNVGLGFLAVGLMLAAESWVTALKILVIWLIALLASAMTCYLIANWEVDHGRRGDDL